MNGIKTFIGILLFKLFVYGLFICLYSNPSFPHFDSYEYYYNAAHLEPYPEAQAKYYYSNVLERTPAYLIYLVITFREILLQIIFTAFGCWLMFRMNKLAGLIWMLYPVSVISSFQYMKEPVLFVCIIILAYILDKKKSRPFFMYTGTLMIILCFSSFNQVYSHNVQLSHGFMYNCFEVWKPDWNLITPYGIYWNFLLFLPYLVFIIYFFRNVKLLSPEFFLAVTITIIYGFIVGQGRYREPLMPLFILYVSRHLSIKYNQTLAIYSLEIEPAVCNQTK